MITTEEPVNQMSPPQECCFSAGLLPPDQPTAVRSFLDHWRPDLCLWSGGDLRPALLKQCREQGIPALLVDIDPEELPERRRRWLPDQSRRLMETFAAILTPSEVTAETLKKAGVAADKVVLTTRLRISATPPLCNEDELDRVHQDLGSRPLWLAAHAETDEIPMILAAHRRALRRLHRMLLVITCEHPEMVADTRAEVEAAGLRLCDWDAGEDFHDNTQVLLTSAEDLGLWLRAAPVTLMAGTLLPGTGGQNPLDAAALGSAILHGACIDNHKLVYHRLTEAGAATAIATTKELAEGVIRLAAPDAAAEAALAGWQVVTEGAHLTDQLMERIQDLLDLREGSNAAV